MQVQNDTAGRSEVTSGLGYEWFEVSERTSVRVVTVKECV